MSGYENSPLFILSLKKNRLKGDQKLVLIR